jgi:hypothetical protein
MKSRIAAPSPKL